MKKLHASALALVLALSAGGAFAHGDRMEDKVMKMDTNKDGMISKSEYHAQTDKWFDMADTNKDGQLSAAERKAAKEKMKEKMHHGKWGDKDGMHHMKKHGTMMKHGDMYMDDGATDVTLHGTNEPTVNKPVLMR